MQVAVRMPSKGTYVTLWKHEHFAVYKNKSKPKGKRELDIYQAMEFRTGGDMPVNCRVGLTEKELAQIWVKGIYYAPAASLHSISQIQLVNQARIKNKNLLIRYGHCLVRMTPQTSPLLMKS